MAARLFRARYGPVVGKVSPRVADDVPASLQVVNPANGEVLTEVTSTSPPEIELAINNAHAIFETGQWSKSSAIHRSTILSRLAGSLRERVGEFASMESLQTGRAIREMRTQLGRLPEWLEYYAALLRTHQAFVAPTQGQQLNYVTRVPLGVVAQITPFNHPLLIAVKKIAPALAAGNSVVVKPSELAPVSVLTFGEMALEAGVPGGVLSVLPGAGSGVGKAIVSHPLVKKVDITAGTATGRAIGGIVGQNMAQYTAELGGKAPVIVFDDADIQAAANGVCFAAFVASGQTCVSGTRILVQSGIYEQFMAALLNKVRDITKRIGNPMNSQSTMGSVISSVALDRISVMVSRTKARILTGGSRMTGLSELDGYDFSKGFFYPPTVVDDISTDDELWQEEVFGPVIVVAKFSSTTEGVKLANMSRYGLGAAIWTQDLARAHRTAADIEAGIVWVNAHHRNDPSSPWGGMKDSGIGRENGQEAFERYTQSKSVIVNYATTDEIREHEDWFAHKAEPARYG